jgi:hypothetical protein
MICIFSLSLLKKADLGPYEAFRSIRTIPPAATRQAPAAGSRRRSVTSVPPAAPTHSDPLLAARHRLGRRRPLRPKPPKLVLRVIPLPTEAAAAAVHSLRSGQDSLSSTDR